MPGFMDLPAELRLQIYEPLLRPRVLDVWSSDTCSGHIPTEQLLKGSFRVYRVNNRLYPALLQTCHRIKDEAEEMLYMPSKLSLIPTFSMRVGRSIDMTKLRIHRLEKLHIRVRANYGGGLKDIEHSEALAGLFDDVGSVAPSLSFEFWDCQWNPVLGGGVIEDDHGDTRCPGWAMLQLIGIWRCNVRGQCSIIFHAAGRGSARWEKKAGDVWQGGEWVGAHKYIKDSTHHIPRLLDKIENGFEMEVKRE